MLIRAALDLVPPPLRARLELDEPQHRLGARERRVIGWVGRLLDRVPLPFAPPAQACRRLGLSAGHLYAR